MKGPRSPLVFFCMGQWWKKFHGIFGMCPDLLSHYTHPSNSILLSALLLHQCCGYWAIFAFLLLRCRCTYILIVYLCVCFYKFLQQCGKRWLEKWKGISLFRCTLISRKLNPGKARCSCSPAGCTLESLKIPWWHPPHMHHTESNTAEELSGHPTFPCYRLRYASVVFIQ